MRRVLKRNLEESFRFRSSRVGKSQEKNYCREAVESPLVLGGASHLSTTWGGPLHMNTRVRGGGYKIRGGKAKCGKI